MGADVGHIPLPLPPALPGLDVYVSHVESLPPGDMREVAGGAAIAPVPYFDKTIKKDE